MKTPPLGVKGSDGANTGYVACPWRGQVLCPHYSIAKGVGAMVIFYPMTLLPKQVTHT